MPVVPVHEPEVLIANFEAELRAEFVGQPYTPETKGRIAARVNRQLMAWQQQGIDLKEAWVTSLYARLAERLAYRS